jgi:hypothetical protein
VQVVRYADLLQVPRAAADAVWQLQAGLCHPDALSLAPMKELASLSAWPSCLLPVIRSLSYSAFSDPDFDAAGDSSSSSSITAGIRDVLVSALGDLEAVWRDLQLMEVLLSLPLSAMQLLLSSDRLRVASEDTVLFTASMYAWRAGDAPMMSSGLGHDRDDVLQEYAEQLAPLIRCQHLSSFQLTLRAAAASSCGPTAVLYNYRDLLPVLASLLRLPGEPQQLLQDVGLDLPIHINPTACHYMPVPKVWLLGPRQLQPAAAEGVEVRWQLPVSSIKEWCGEVFTRAFGGSKICSPSHTPPLAGLAWSVGLLCNMDPYASGVTVELAVSPCTPPGFSQCLLQVQV